MSTTAASSLPPAYPGRAPWGTATKLRAWQQAALDAYHSRDPRDFLAVATPGAGKTTFALRLATDLLQRGVIRAVTVVAPTEHLKRQWAEAAHRVGIELDPEFKNSQGAHAAGLTGVAVTYAQVAMAPMLHRARTEARPTLVILDEVHHGGDALSWGDAVREAFEPARRRLALTGTPFRSDTAAIPFVTYERDAAGVRRSVADYSYGYGEALRDGVVRPVIFLAYGGSMRWRTSAGDEVAATLGADPLTKDLTSQAWRTALDPYGNWVPQVLTAADRRLSEVRRHVPDAAGLVIATDHSTARAYAARLRAISGEPATVVLSDDPTASKRIAEFAAGTTRWMVAVRMVSEGVDVPRLAVGVYATSTSTPLFFAQAVGRFVRARRRGEMASVFLPTVPILLEHAGAMELERDHALDRPVKEDDFDPEAGLLAEANRQRDAPDGGVDALPFEALEAEATFDRVLFDGGEFGMQAEVGSEEEEDYLGLPGLLEPDQVSVLLQQRQAKQIARGRKAPEPEPAAASPIAADALAGLRKELNALVAAWHHRTGQPHGVIHGELRRTCGGPPSSTASAEHVQKRIDRIRDWHAKGRTLA
ncbi:superfamily II DNA or RNA helicase [Motilibacter peucedani]|uniref:Superfamily II DNA or RNA helicase n=1 Tax=Motilibacter peucedani TaxID=598650 RepID=A0A420XN74_9ACTN|nr:DEAD/DEAH box helicase [Motilibacter peucedani]RKS72722.1 superfamily II DNA or RNA helicase [Motilibacter peucedani]